jgi:hypothetical protein
VFLKYRKYDEILSMRLTILAILLVSGIAFAQFEQEPSEEAGSSCVCTDRIPWGWADCPGNRMMVCDTCYSPDGGGIIAYVPRSSPDYVPGSGCEDLALGKTDNVIFVAQSVENLKEMEAAGADCDSNLMICQNVPQKVFQLGDTKTTGIAEISEISLKEAKEHLKKAHSVISWDSYFRGLFAAMASKWGVFHDSPFTSAYGSYVICKQDTGDFTATGDPSGIYGDAAVVERVNEMLHTLPGRVLVFPAKTAICALRVKGTQFSFTQWKSTSQQGMRHVLEIDGKLYGFYGDYTVK